MLGATPLLGSGIPAGGRALAPLTPVGVVAAIVLAGAALGCAVFHRHRLVAVVLVGVVGLVVSAAFLQFSAPDLALTQLAVEVVTTVLLLHRAGGAAANRPGRVVAAAPARATGSSPRGFGLGTGFVALAVMTRPLETISWYFVEKSVPLGGGANVVNVILVDFRGYDTFGELTVLVHRGARRRARSRTGSRPARPAAVPLLLAVAARWLLPLALLLSIFLLRARAQRPGRRVRGRARDRRRRCSSSTWRATDRGSGCGSPTCASPRPGCWSPARPASAPGSSASRSSPVPTASRCCR